MDMRSFRAKYASEEYYIAFDFFRELAPGDTVSTATVAVTDDVGEDATETLTDVDKQVVSGTRVNVWVKGGEEQTYTISCAIVTASGEKYEQRHYQEVFE
jgi:hypothetical protein